jgi:polysaccharide biosynthesis/export protein
MKMKLRDMRGFFAAVVLLLLTVASAVAQTTEETYRLRPDDVLRLQVYGHAEIAAEIPVGRDGNISAPFVGTVRAEGRTTADLEAELARLYEEKLRIREPKISIIVLQYHPRLASVGGQVLRPGVFQIRPGDTLLTLLHLGGDPVTNGAADLRRAMFRRAKSQEVIPVDLYAMLVLGDMSQNYPIDEGDELIVPEERNNRVLVQGMVRNPGVFPYREPMTVQDAVSLAGGEVPHRSRFSRTMVFRRRAGLPDEITRIQVDYVRYVKKGDVSQNIELKPGDMIYVPETDTPDLNYISGIVNSLFFFDRFFQEGIFGFRPFR